MMTIEILTLILVGTFVSVAVEIFADYIPDMNCVNSKESGLMKVNCAYIDLLEVPSNILPDVEFLDLRHNYIGKLTNDSFALYPNIKKLILSMNKVHTIEPESLASLTELETLDLTQNALKEIPAGLPKSLRRLYLNSNPMENFQNLNQAVGLQVLQLKNCEMVRYPTLGLLPNLVELDVSNNKLTDVDPVQLASTCRLAKLNVTGSQLFRPERPGSYCQCQSVLKWTETYKIRLYGLDRCPDDGGDPANSQNCTQTPEAATAVFKACMAEWEHRNTPYWAICSGIAVIVVLAVAMCLCLRRRNRRGRRRADKAAQIVPPADGKQQNNDAAAANKTEPAALLPST